MKLPGWTAQLLTVAVWGFLAAGAIGLAEGIYQWLRFDVVGGMPMRFGLFRQLAPTFTFSGCVGMGLSAVVLLLLLAPAARRRWPASQAVALAVGAMLGSLLTVFADYMIYEHLGWWDDLDPSRWSWLVLACFWCAAVMGFGRLLRRPAGLVMAWPEIHLLPGVLVILVAVFLWPNWRSEGRRIRTEHLSPMEQPAAGLPGAPNLVLISVDTWRYDSLSILNSRSAPTPSLDQFCGDAVLFDNVWSTSPWTLPAMATLLTGMPPLVLQQDRQMPLPGTVPVLGEMAWREGYRTAAFCTNGFMTGYFGFDRGFSHFEHDPELEFLLPVPRSVLARQLTRVLQRYVEMDGAETVIPKSIAWLQEYEKDEPFCLWIHLLDPHLPYTWKDLPEDPAAPTTEAGVAPTPGEIPDHEYFAHRRFNELHKARAGLVATDEASLRGMKALYDREIQNGDYWIGALLRTLRELGYYENSLIAVVGDHGEEFFEYDGYEHGHTLMPPVTRVPLILKLPGGEGAGHRVSEAVSSLDVLPTLLAKLKWRAPLDLPGRSLWPREDLPEDAALVFENMLYGPSQRGVLSWPWLRVDHLEDGGRNWFRMTVEGRAEPDQPPAATVDFVASRADSLVAAWESLRDELGLAQMQNENRAVPEALRRELKALGY